MEREREALTMTTPTAILAIISLILFVLSLVPTLDSRLAALGGILLSIAVFLGKT
jgi:hypothetical protein